MNLPLRGVAIYNPALLSKEELIAQFIARKPLLETILNDLRKQDRLDHRILIGPRGMGKTTLLRRIQFAVEDEPVLSKRWIALPFPEEQYNLARLSDFYLNCIDALGDALVHLGRTGEAEGLDRLRDALPDGNEDVRAEGALKLLLATANRLERRLILLIDNLEMVLDRLAPWEWKLRELLGHDARLCVIGASAFTPEQTYEYGKAFYEFFRIHELRPLSEPEARQVLLHLADVRKAPQITKIVNEEPARVRTLLTLAGGNPRTLVQLYALLAQSSEGDARTDLERLLDECTPIYKAKFEALSVQAQQIVDAVALHWHPATVADIAAMTRLDPNVISSQVNRLFKDGLLEAVQAVEGNRKTYQIAERFFNIWYLMRASRRVRQRLIWLVESLRLVYGQDELPAHARHRLSAALPDTAGHRVRDAEYRMALAQAVEGKALKRALVSSALRPPEKSLYWADLGDVLETRGRYQEAAEAYRRATTLDPPWEWAWLYLGQVLENHLDQPQEAEAAYRSGVRAKDTDVRRYTLWWLTWNRYRRGIADAETEHLARAQMTSESDAGDTLLLASILVRRGSWDEPLRLAQSALSRATAEEHADWWGIIVVFFSEVAHAKGAAVAIQVLHDLGFAERWLPLHAALVAVRDGDRALRAFAPEVRRPAETLLGRLMGRDPAPQGDAATSNPLPCAATAPVAAPAPVASPPPAPADDKAPSAHRSAEPSKPEAARRTSSSPARPRRPARKLSRTPAHKA